MPDAEYEKALEEEKAMKELAAEINNILGRIDKLNMSELFFLEDSLVGTIITIGQEIEAKDPYRSTHQDVLNRLIKYVGGVKVHIAATNENVTHSSVARKL